MLSVVSPSNTRRSLDASLKQSASDSPSVTVVAFADPGQRPASLVQPGCFGDAVRAQSLLTHGDTSCSQMFRNSRLTYVVPLHELGRWDAGFVLRDDLSGQLGGDAAAERDWPTLPTCLFLRL